jgi:hypothetical protein
MPEKKDGGYKVDDKTAAKGYVPPGYEDEAEEEPEPQKKPPPPGKGKD